MPDIQTSEPGQKLARRYGIKGQIVTPSLESIIVPVVLVDDLSQEAAVGVPFAIAGEDQAATVGELPQAALTNPAGSNVLLEQISFGIYSNNAFAWELYKSGPALSSAATEEWQDFRLAGSPVGRVTHGTDVGAVADKLANGRAVADQGVVFDLPNLIMDVGDRLHILITSANIIMSFWWQWSERLLTAEEAF